MKFPTLSPGFKLVLKGATAAFAAGFVAAASAYFMDSAHYTLDHLKAFVPVGLASGCMGLGLYLRKSPVAQWLWEREGGIDKRGTTDTSLKTSDVVKKLL